MAEGCFSPLPDDFFYDRGLFFAPNDAFFYGKGLFSPPNDAFFYGRGQKKAIEVGKNDFNGNFSIA